LVWFDDYHVWFGGFGGQQVLFGLVSSNFGLVWWQQVWFGLVAANLVWLS
jgi:hypothetical protein